MKTRLATCTLRGAFLDSNFSATKKEVSGKIDVPVVTLKGLLADVGIEAHLHKLLYLVLLGDFSGKVLRPGLRRVLKHLAVVLVHAGYLSILGVI